MEVRIATLEDRDWAMDQSKIIGGPVIGRRSELMDLGNLPIWVAVAGDHPVGFASGFFSNGTAELAAILATEPGRGIGTALLDIVADAARQKGCRTLAVVTTNDNLSALAFYQKRGFRMSHLRSGAFREVLALKGGDPDEVVRGASGIAIRDEIELVLDL